MVPPVERPTGNPFAGVMSATDLGIEAGAVVFVGTQQAQGGPAASYTYSNSDSPFPPARGLGRPGGNRQ